MDRSDDLTRNRRFNSLDLGNGRTRPRIVTSRDERVAPKGTSAANRPPQPSLEFRARQRLRTYAEASTIMDRQTPRDASSAARGSFGEAPSPADTTPERAYSDVIPEPPSPMAEAYVGRTPQLTRREAAQHNLESATVTDEPVAEPMPLEVDLDDEAPIVSAAAENLPTFQPDEPAITATRSTDESPAVVAEWSESDATPVFAGRAGFDDEDEAAFQTPNPKPGDRLSNVTAAASTALGKSSAVIQNLASKSAVVAKSLVANAGPMWQNLRKRTVGLTRSVPALPQIAASSGEGVKGRVSRLPANSLLTPQAGLLAASARADASNARPDANVRPLRNEGILGQEPEPKRTLLARKIQDDVERTETRTAAPVGPITTARRGRMAISALALIVVTLMLLGLGAWVTVSILQRTNTPVSAIGETERYRIEAILDALFIDPGAVDGVIDDRTISAINQYSTEYGYTGPKEISTSLLQHLEDEADAMGLLDLIQ